jgi:probable rRNA maturation factor
LLRDLLGLQDFELDLHVVGAAEMTRLNETFLQHQGSTDVITFDHAEPGEALHGEIFVCVDEALIQARRFRTTWQSELLRYVVHGVLHLCGYDDQEPAARRRMKRAENRWLRELERRSSQTQRRALNPPPAPDGNLAMPRG